MAFVIIKRNKSTALSTMNIRPVSVHLCYLSELFPISYWVMPQAKHKEHANTLRSVMRWECFIISTSSRNESSVMRFDQTLKLNETWRGLARPQWGMTVRTARWGNTWPDPPPPSIPQFGLGAARPHATGPGVFPPRSVSRDSHQTPPLQICIA